MSSSIVVKTEPGLAPHIKGLPFSVKVTPKPVENKPKGPITKGTLAYWKKRALEAEDKLCDARWSLFRLNGALRTEIATQESLRKELKRLSKNKEAFCKEVQKISQEQRAAFDSLITRLVPESDASGCQEPLSVMPFGERSHQEAKKLSEEVKETTKDLEKKCPPPPDDDDEEMVFPREIEYLDSSDDSSDDSLFDAPSKEEKPSFVPAIDLFEPEPVPEKEEKPSCLPGVLGDVDFITPQMNNDDDSWEYFPNTHFPVEKEKKEDEGEVTQPVKEVFGVEPRVQGELFLAKPESLSCSWVAQPLAGSYYFPILLDEQ